MSFGQFQLRRDTAANWTSANPTLLAGEFGFEIDTLAIKLGDGSTAWTSLGYYSTKIRFGSGIPSGSLGVVGDLYISSTGELYLKTAVSTWTAEVSLVGPTGSTGSTGPPGAVNTVAALDSSVTVAGTTNVTVSRAALTGDITASAGSNTTTLKNTGPGTTGPIGDSTHVSTQTIDAQGRTTALTSTTIQSATTSQPGFESAAQFNTTANQWVDVTNYGVSISNSGTANTAAMNTLISTTFGASTRFFFPATGANYPFSGAILVTKNNQTFMGAGQVTSVLFQDSTTDDLFRISDGVSCPTFMDLGFWSTVAMSSGSAINCGTVSGSGVSQLAVYRCGIAGFGGTWFNGIVLNGNISGISTIISDCQINAFTNWGIACIGNTTTPSSVAAAVVQNTTMNGGITSTTGAVAGIYLQQCGAFQIIATDVISCTNNLLISPLVSTAQIVASVYALNSYFDHAFGSCIKIAGAGATVRCKFVQCYMTIGPGSTGYSALEIAGTGVNEGISFIGCSFLNTFGNTGTSNGILLTNVYDFQVIASQISGFTNGIQATPIATAATTRLMIQSNLIGPGGGLSGNTTGILLNAGSATYGQVIIIDNQFSDTQGSFTANTTNITDNSATAPGGGKLVDNNLGLVTAPATQVPNALIPLTTVTLAGANVNIPAGVRVGTKIRIIAHLTNAATLQTLTPTLHFGTAGTNADASVCGLGLAVGTAAVGGGRIEAEFIVTSSTTCMASIETTNTAVAAAGTGLTGLTTLEKQMSLSGGATPGPVTIATTTASFLGLYLSSATAAAVTVRTVEYEVTQQ